MKRKDAAEASHHTRPVMTVREVSVYLRVHPITIYRLLKKIRFPRITWAAIGASTSRISTAGASSSRASSHTEIVANNFLANSEASQGSPYSISLSDGVDFALGCDCGAVALFSYS